MRDGLDATPGGESRARLCDAMNDAYRSSFSRATAPSRRSRSIVRDALNALDLAMIDALVDAPREVAADDALRVVVLRGAGKHFMAGGDIRTFAGRFAQAAGGAASAHFARMIGRLHAAIEHAAPDAASGRRRACRARSPASACR